jgi:hypothetical protein
MSNEQEAPTATEPIEQHNWLKNLIGEWDVKYEMIMEPGGEPVHSSGTEVVEDFGGLWSLAKGAALTPDEQPFTYYQILGYDVTFHEYRGCWFADVSSHLWKYQGEMSPDQKTLTLNCEGPHMTKDNTSAMYRDVITLIDDRTRRQDSFFQDEESGEWVPMVTATFTRK